MVRIIELLAVVILSVCIGFDFGFKKGEDKPAQILYEERIIEKIIYKDDPNIIKLGYIGDFEASEINSFFSGFLFKNQKKEIIEMMGNKSGAIFLYAELNR